MEATRVGEAVRVLDFERIRTRLREFGEKTPVTVDCRITETRPLFGDVRKALGYCSYCTAGAVAKAESLRGCGGF